jgi:hypothetical protein
MSEKLGGIYDIQTVTEIQSGTSDVKLTFQSGLTANLSVNHPDRDLILREAERSLCHRDPVGVMVDAAGTLVDLEHAQQVAVRYVEDDAEDSNRLQVAFWGYCAICYLTRDHPEFERMRATLVEAAVRGEEVWFANRTWPVEGEAESWNKIMVIRPVKTPHVLQPWNGLPSLGANGTVTQGDSATQQTR